MRRRRHHALARVVVRLVVDSIAIAVVVNWVLFTVADGKCELLLYRRYSSVDVKPVAWS